VSDGDERALDRQLGGAAIRDALEPDTLDTVSPSTSSSVVFQRMSTFPSRSRSNSLSWRIFSPRSLSRRWTRVTWLQMLAR
jgi:hypothetical protein